jgi:naphthoate synthase
MIFEDILYEKNEGVAKIIINRPDRFNAFRTETLMEMVKAFEDIELDRTIGVAVLTGAGKKAFCVGGDAGEAKGAGYRPELLVYVRKVHDMIRKLPVPLIAAVNGYAIGGGHVFQVLCDLTVAAETAVFGQAGPRVGSFDAGYGAAYLARVVGEKKAREIWFLCEQYSAQEALDMGLVNKVVPLDKLEEEVNEWCRKMLALSPTALKFLKASFNRESDHLAGSEALAFDAMRLYYETEEATEGKQAYLEKRRPDFSKYRK